LNTLKEELSAYDPALLEKPQLIVFNKNDQENSEENFLQLLSGGQLPSPSHWIKVSALTGEGCSELLTRLQQLKKELPSASQAQPIDPFF